MLRGRYEETTSVEFQLNRTPVEISPAVVIAKSTVFRAWAALRQTYTANALVLFYMEQPVIFRPRRTYNASGQSSSVVVLSVRRCVRW